MGAHIRPGEEVDDHMASPHSKLVRRLVLVAAVTALLSACSSGDVADPLERLQNDSRELSAALTNAVTATNDARTGYADEEFAARAIGRAESSIASFDAETRSVTDPAVARLASDMSLAAQSVVSALRAGEVDRAERLRLSQFAPLTGELAAVQSDVVAPARTEDDVDRGSSFGVLLAASLLVTGLVAIVAVRRAGQRTAPRKAGIPSGSGSTGLQRMEPGMARAPGTEVDAPRTAKARRTTVELSELLERALAQSQENGWEVSVISPEITVSADPLRLQRVVTAAVGAAFLRGAEHAGVVVDPSDDQIVISIGDDGGPIEDGTSREAMEGLEERVRQAFAGSRVDVGWHRHDGVTVFSITIPRGGLEPLAEEAESRQLV